MRNGQLTGTGTSWPCMLSWTIVAHRTARSPLELGHGTLRPANLHLGSSIWCQRASYSLWCHPKAWYGSCGCWAWLACMWLKLELRYTAPSHFLVSSRLLSRPRMHESGPMWLRQAPALCAEPYRGWLAVLSDGRHRNIFKARGAKAVLREEGRSSHWSKVGGWTGGVWGHTSMHRQIAR